MTVSEGRRMHTKSLRRIINMLKGASQYKVYLKGWFTRLQICPQDLLVK